MNTKKRVKYGTKEVTKDFGELTFAQVLLAHRQGEGLSQADMAEELGISRQSLCDLEKGRKIPSPSRAAKIARILGMLPESFIELALQDQLRSEKLNFTIKIEPKPKKKAS